MQLSSPDWRDDAVKGLCSSNCTVLNVRIIFADCRCLHRGVARFDNGLPVPAQTISMVFGSGGRRAGMIPLDDRHVYW